MAANIAADGELPMPTLEVKPIFFTSNIISFAKCSSPPNKWLQPVILRSSDFSFFVEIISHESWHNPVKISNFGTFYNHETPKRIGRNPLTKKEFVINKRQKITFRSWTELARLRQG